MLLVLLTVATFRAGGYSLQTLTTESALVVGKSAESCYCTASVLDGILLGSSLLTFTFNYLFGISSEQTTIPCLRKYLVVVRHA